MEDNINMTTVIFASPRKNGFTAQVTNKFLSSASNNTEIEFVDIYSVAPAPCTACGECKKAYKCRMHDLDSVLKKIEKSDRLIFASPIYNYSFPSPMKAFLDRLQPFYEKGINPPRKNKKAFLITTCAQSGKYSFDIVRRQSSMAFSLLGFDFSGEIMIPFTDKSGLPDNFASEPIKKAEIFFKSDFLEENL